jgi:hypothetical protein
MEWARILHASCSPRWAVARRSDSLSSRSKNREPEAEQDSDDVDSLYLLIQRQFEDPDDDWCYIGTHDKNYIGHFRLRCVEFTPQNLSIEFDRPADNLVSVTFVMAASDFEDVSRVVKIISGEIELP